MIRNTKEYVSAQYRDSSNLDIRILFHERYSVPSHDWHEWVFEQLEFGPACRIMELGCGSGSLWVKNKQRIAGGWSITLTDLSEGMLETARRSVGDLPGFSFLAADIQSLQAEDRTYDFVLANHMLYHVPDLEKALSEVSRVLKPEGTFYAATNGERHLSEIYTLVEQFDPSLPFANPRITEHFGLENGEARLSPFFADIRLVRFFSELRVTHAQDLADYICSIGHELEQTLRAKGNYSAFIEFLETQKNQEGYIPISKASGLFVCRSPKRGAERHA